MSIQPRAFFWSDYEPAKRKGASVLEAPFASPVPDNTLTKHPKKTLSGDELHSTNNGT